MRVCAVCSLSAIITRGRLPRQGPLPDQAPFIFSQSPEDLKHPVACRDRGIHPLRERDKLDALRVQCIDKAQQILQVPPQAVEPPQHQHGVFPHLLPEALQLGPVGTGHGADIGEKALTAGTLQGILLQGVGLFVGKDACIAKFHASILPQPGRTYRYQDIVLGGAFMAVLGRYFSGFWVFSGVSLDPNFLGRPVNSSGKLNWILSVIPTSIGYSLFSCPPMGPSASDPFKQVKGSSFQLRLSEGRAGVNPRLGTGCQGTISG